MTGLDGSKQLLHTLGVDAHVLWKDWVGDGCLEAKMGRLGVSEMRVDGSGTK